MVSGAGGIHHHCHNLGRLLLLRNVQQASNVCPGCLAPFHLCAPDVRAFFGTKENVQPYAAYSNTYNWLLNQKKIRSYKFAEV